MGLPGEIDVSVYEGLRDVLQRQPEITTVTYEPNAIIKRSLRATIDPNRVAPATGPISPTLDVEWRFGDEVSYYRIHYSDPNSGFNCGWHRDRDHPDLGPVHFQYEDPETGTSEYSEAYFSKTVPTEILWGALERLFDIRLPELTTG